MRGSPVLYPTRQKLKAIFPVSRSINGEITRTVAPEKQRNGNENEGGSMKKNEKTTDPIVAFNRPPPFPPLFGPLVALSLLETWSNRDREDN